MCEVKDGVLRIGNTHTQVYIPDNATKIPDTLFFDIDQVMRPPTLSTELLKYKTARV